VTPRLRNMLTAVGVFALGVGVYVFTPQPATRTMLELKDAGILDGQRLVVICPERLTKQTKRRIEANQPGLLRPAQSYALVARSARCFNPDAGNCLRPSDGLLRVGTHEAELIIPSLRADLAGVDLDASVGTDDGGDNDDVDDALQFDVVGCRWLTCTQFDDGVTAGTYASPYANGCLGGLNRLALQPMPCMLPNGWGRGADGGWCEEECGGPVDCRCGGPFGEADGGPRWRGFNVCPREHATGAACVPVACGVAQGDVPSEWL
jgi:hypothetical protein